MTGEDQCEPDDYSTEAHISTNPDEVFSRNHHYRCNGYRNEMCVDSDNEVKEIRGMYCLILCESDSFLPDKVSSRLADPLGLIRAFDQLVLLHFLQLDSRKVWQKKNEVYCIGLEVESLYEMEALSRVYEEETENETCKHLV